MFDLSTAILVRTVYSLLTLYMMLILLRWLGPWLQLDIYGRWRWLGRLTDPLVNKIRRFLPPVGSMDFAPLGAVFLVWIVRVLLTGT